MADRAMVRRWLAEYEAAWRAPGTEALAVIFTDDAGYRQSPCQEPVAGRDAIRRMWDDEREGPDEVFTIATDILAGFPGLSLFRCPRRRRPARSRRSPSTPGR
jgi:hypothetical protein